MIGAEAHRFGDELREVAEFLEFSNRFNPTNQRKRGSNDNVESDDKRSRAGGLAA